MKTKTIEDKKTILVVDDEEVMRDILSETLSDAGFAVRTAASGEEALDLMRAEQSRVAFLDLKLPGMNGSELCSKIHDEWPMTVLFAVTGYSSLFELSDCREAGFEDYFTKPPDRKLIVLAAKQAFAKIERWMKR